MIGDKSDYYEEKFVRVVLDSQLVSGVEFSDCIFQDCSFQESSFRYCKFSGCRFVSCNLSLLRVEGSTFSRLHFEDSQLIGVNWALANWSSGSRIKAFDFFRCILSYSIFMGVDLQDIQMVECIAIEVDFSDADLRDANFRRTDFLGSRFVNTNLSRADLSQAINYQIDATQNLLKKTKFSLPEAMSLLRSLDIELVE